MSNVSLDGLNPSQQEAVVFNDGNLLVSAGAGSGKTRVIAYKIAYLTGELLVPEQNILAMTFTNKAADEMRERVKFLLNKEYFFGQISTFHSFCLRVLRREAHFLGYSSDFAICDSYDSVQIVKEIINYLNLRIKQKPKLIQGLISAKKNGMEIALPEQIREDVFKQIVSHYQDYLKKNNLMDFDDLLLNTLSLFEENESVLDYYSSNYPFILVDEFQDTNMTQYSLLKLLSKNSVHLCVVGDEDQSIYGWRGAQYKNVSRFIEDFKDVKIIKLEKNYRSTIHILDVANSLIENNTDRIKKKLFSEISKKGEMVIYGAVDSKEEARFVIDKVEELINNGEPLSQIAILYRANYLSRQFEDILVERRIPYKIIGGIRFYERKEIKDIVAYLRLLNNPYDNISFKRVINLPKRGIGQKTLEKLEDYSPSFYLAIDFIPSTFPKFKIFKSFKEAIERLKKLEFDTSFFDLFLEEMGYKEYLKSEYFGYELESRYENLMEFRSVLNEYIKRSESPSLKGFLDTISLVSDADEVSDNVLNLMTIHASKGLEFNSVFVVGLEEGVFPSLRSSGSNEKIEEERRLMYVAITRAKTNLFLSFSGQRGFSNKYFEKKEVSRFIKELPLEKFSQIGLPIEVEQNFESASYSSNQDFQEETIVGELKKGDNVFHPRYGDGNVMNVLDGGKKAVVRFKRVGVRILNPSGLKRRG